MKCPFCVPNDVVIAKNKHAYVILDRNPVMKGHLLVVPKKHYECITEIPLKELTAVMSLVKEMERRLIKRMDVKGLSIRQNWAPFLKENGLVVRHLHFHIIPREFNDKMAKAVPRLKMNPKEKNKIVKKLQ